MNLDFTSCFFLWTKDSGLRTKLVVIVLSLCLPGCLIYAAGDRKIVDLNEVEVPAIAQSSANYVECSEDDRFLLSWDLNDSEFAARGIFSQLKKSGFVGAKSSGQKGPAFAVLGPASGAQQVAVEIDGVEIFDPSNVRQQFDISGISIWSIGKLCMNLGSGSSSTDMGGAVGTFSLETPYAEHEGTNLKCFIEGGSMRSIQGGVSVKTKGQLGQIVLYADCANSAGMSDAWGAIEKDGYDKENIAMRSELVNGDGIFKIGSTLRWLKAEYDYDDWVLGAPADDPNKTSKTRTFISSIYLKAEDSLWKCTLIAGTSDLTRKNQDDPDIASAEYMRSKYGGKLRQLKGICEFKGPIFVRVGAAYLLQKARIFFASSSTGVPADLSSSYFTSSWLADLSGWSKIVIPLQKFSLSGEGRLKKRSGKNLYAGWNISIFRNFKDQKFYIGARVSSSFTFPSLYQLYAPPAEGIGFLGGNMQLSPERTYIAEVNLKKKWSKINLYLHLYKASHKDMISYLYNPITFSGTYENASSGRVIGSLLCADSILFKYLNIEAAWSYLHSYDSRLQGPFLRRPQNSFYFKISYKTDPLDLSMETIYIGKRHDLGNTYLKRFFKVDFCMNVKIAKNITTTLRLENIFNQKYTYVSGYCMPGFSAFGGVIVKFGSTHES